MKSTEFYADNPDAFLYDKFGVTLWEKQKEILYALRDNDRVTVRSGNALGKSFVAAGAAMWFLLTHHPSVVITTAPTDRQVKNIIWREMATMYYKGGGQEIVGGEFFQKTTRFELESNWYALGFASDKADRFQGYHSENILIIADEPSGIDEVIFEGIEGILAGGNAKLLLIGNPLSMVGYYRDSHLDPRKAQHFHQIHISGYDSPNVIQDKTVIIGLATPKWIKEKEEDWGSDNPLFRIKVLGEFADQGVDTLINLQWINNAVKRYADNEKAELEGPRIMGVDVARFGDDETVYGIRQGIRLLRMEGWHKWDTMKTADWLHGILRGDTLDHVMIDSIGIGAGVVDRLKQQHHKIKGVNVGDKAKAEDDYANLRAEIFWNLRKRFERGEIEIPDDPKLTAQLAGLKYEYDDKGRIKMQAKKDAKKEGQRSPDRADMLALCFMEKRKRLVVGWG